ncbi:MAG TPA: hypothetical protein VK487_10230 [Candidatus Bathyarchaeia archaeon]|nr:hypothetical protein [Candidatus Bathyarchaeia archaeon]
MNITLKTNEIIPSLANVKYGTELRNKLSTSALSKIILATTYNQRRKLAYQSVKNTAFLVLIFLPP